MAKTVEQICKKITAEINAIPDQSTRSQVLEWLGKSTLDFDGPFSKTLLSRYPSKEVMEVVCRHLKYIPANEYYARKTP